GKPDAVTEAVVVALAPLRRAPLALDDQAGVGEARAIGVRGAEAAEHLVPGVGRVADREALDGLGGKSPLGEIVAGACFARETLRVAGRDARHQRGERLGGAAGGAAAGRDLPRNREPEARGEFLDRLGEGHVVVIHEEAEHRAVLAAAEAVVELLVRAHRERGGLLVVERAAGLVFAPGLLQRHAGADDLHDVGAGDQLVDEVLGDASQVLRATAAPREGSAEFLFDPRADCAQLGATLGLRLHGRHDLAHVLDRGRSGRGDRLADQRIALFMSSVRRSLSAIACAAPLTGGAHAVARHTLHVALDGRGLLALALLGGFLVELAPAQLGENAGLLTGALEAPQGGIEVLILTNSNARHRNLKSLIGMGFAPDRPDPRRLAGRAGGGGF